MYENNFTYLLRILTTQNLSMDATLSRFNVPTNIISPNAGDVLEQAQTHEAINFRKCSISVQITEDNSKKVISLIALMAQILSKDMHVVK